jgi:hypothetical protein
MVTQAPTSSQEEHEDVVKNPFGEFTRMERIQSNPSSLVLGMVTRAPTSLQEEQEDVF